MPLPFSLGRRDSRLDTIGIRLARPQLMMRRMFGRISARLVTGSAPFGSNRSHCVFMSTRMRPDMTPRIDVLISASPRVSLARMAAQIVRETHSHGESLPFGPRDTEEGQTVQ